MLAAVPGLAMVFFGPSLFAWGLGVDWRTAGVFSQFLSLNLVAALGNIPAVSLVPLLRIQRWHAAYEAVYTVTRLAALVGGGMLAGPVGAVAGMSSVGFVFNAVLVVTVLRRLRAHLGEAG